MDFPIRTEAISMGLSIWTLRGHRLIFLNYDEFLSLKVVLILTNSADPDEMQHYAAFHLDLHCLTKNPFRVSNIQGVKGITKDLIYPGAKEPEIMEGGQW